MKPLRKLATLSLGACLMTQAAIAMPDTPTDNAIDPQVRAFLKEVNKDPSPFWTLPGPQVRATLTGLQDKYPVDMSGVTIASKSIDAGGRKVKLYIVKPQNAQGPLPVILFIHGGVWIAADRAVKRAGTAATRAGRGANPRTGDTGRRSPARTGQVPRSGDAAHLWRRAL